MLSYGTHSDVIEQWILLFCKSSKCREESRGQRHIYRKTRIEKERKFIYYGVEVTAYYHSKKMIDEYMHTYIDRQIDTYIGTQRDRQMDTYTDRYIDRNIGTQIDRQIDRYIHTQIDRQID